MCRLHPSCGLTQLEILKATDWVTAAEPRAFPFLSSTALHSAAHFLLKHSVSPAG